MPSAKLLGLESQEVRQNQPSSPARLISLEIARGVVILLVVLNHVTATMASPTYLGKLAFGGLSLAGQTRVGFFFTLSGFLMWWVYNAKLSHPASFISYLLNRLLRIYPTYWIMLSLITLASLLTPYFHAGYDQLTMVRMALLLPQDKPFLIGSAWMLPYLLMCQMLFGLAILSWSIGRGVFAAWGVLAMVSLGADPTSSSALLWWFSLSFLSGMLSASYTLAHRLPRPRIVAVVGIALFTGASVGASLPDLSNDGVLAVRCLYFFSSMLTVSGLAGSEIAGLGFRHNFLRPLGLIGVASYSVLLVHTLASVLLLKIGAALGLNSAMPAELILVVLFITSVALGLASYRFAEMPITHSGKKLIARMGYFLARRKFSLPLPDIQNTITP